MLPNKKDFLKESEFFKSQLLDNILPFWIKHSRDEQCGGYHTCLNRDGSVFDYDKVCTWGQGRIMWTFGYLYNEFEQRPEWLQMAVHGIEFMQKYGFDDDGRLYYSLTREGKPLAETRDVFAELSLVAGLAECFKATGDRELLGLAKKCLFTVTKVVDDPRTNPHRHYLSQFRPVSLNAEYMILLNTSQLLRKVDDDPRYDQISRECVDKILNLHFSPANKCVFEAVAPDGSALPGRMGRWICPGHMIELGWFLIHEAQYRNDQSLIEKGINIMEWGMDWGWDKTYGGLINDVDIEGKFGLGSECVNASFKMWWSVLEALYAMALAYLSTGKQKFLDDYTMIKKWSFKHFADDEYGEWYGYLSIEGHILDGRAKGTDKKNCFHIGRAFYLCHRIFEKLAAG